jgi:NTE family protein
MALTPADPRRTALLLTGGGARAAYQVGVLQALAQIRRDAGVTGVPFGIVCGTSAGALNAAAVATHIDTFDTGVDALTRLWSTLRPDDVYRADVFNVVRTGSRWLGLLSLGWAIQRWRRLQPQSLLDNSPLRELLAQHVDFSRLPQLLADGHLRALAITASSYTSGRHLTFYQAAEPLTPWLRSQRVALADTLGLDHLMASAAIPFVFPPQALKVEGRTEWCGDGTMRQTAPISPAIHLGADRVLVVGAGRIAAPGEDDRSTPGPRSTPSLAQVAGHAMSGIFLDALAVDIERLQRINRTLALLPPTALAHTPLRPVDVLVISPSRRLDELAGAHVRELPAPILRLLGALGVRGRGGAAKGSALVSYLLFVRGYTTELITLGMVDTLARREEVCAFFGWPTHHADPGWERLRRQGYLTD